MDFSLSPEEKEIRDKAREFVRLEMMPLEEGWPLDANEVPKEERDKIVQKAREWGLYHISLPKEYGGQGKGVLARVLAQEQLFYTWILNYSTIMFGFPPHPALFDAPEEMKEKYLYPVTQGGRFYHFLFSEPDAGSDFASIKTKAVKKGDTYVLNGMKMWSPDPTEAAYLIVYATTDPSKGYKAISPFIVDIDNPGFKTIKLYKTMGEGGLLDTVSEIAFEDCVVPLGNRLGQEGEGFRLGMKQLNTNRLWIVSGHLGRIKRCFDMARDYANQRVTFGQPLASRQTIQWWLADSLMELHMARLLVYHAAWKVDQGEDTRVETAMTKALIPEIGCRIIDRAIQIYGGRGYLKETRLEAAYRHTRGSRIAEGTGEILRMVVSRAILQQNVSLEFD